jgi:hypothetical protein
MFLNLVFLVYVAIEMNTNKFKTLLIRGLIWPIHYASKLVDIYVKPTKTICME